MRPFFVRNALKRTFAALLIATCVIGVPCDGWAVGASGAMGASAIKCAQQLYNASSQSYADGLNRIRSCADNNNCKQSGLANFANLFKNFPQMNQGIMKALGAAFSGDFLSVLKGSLMSSVQQMMPQMMQSMTSMISPGAAFGADANEGMKVVQPGQPQYGTCPMNIVTSKVVFP